MQRGVRDTFLREGEEAGWRGHWRPVHIRVDLRSISKRNSTWQFGCSYRTPSSNIGYGRSSISEIWLRWRLLKLLSGWKDRWTRVVYVVKFSSLLAVLLVYQGIWYLMIASIAASDTIKQFLCFVFRNFWKRSDATSLFTTFHNMNYRLSKPKISSYIKYI